MGQKARNESFTLQPLSVPCCSLRTILHFLSILRIWCMRRNEHHVLSCHLDLHAEQPRRYRKHLSCHPIHGHRLRKSDLDTSVAPPAPARRTFETLQHGYSWSLARVSPANPSPSTDGHEASAPAQGAWRTPPIHSAHREGTT